MEEELILYIIVNSTLPKKMTSGKVAGQVGHAVQYCIEDMIVNNRNLYNEYKNSLCVKIVLQAKTEEELNNILSLTNKKFIVIDAGRTQIEPNSLTAISFLPMKRKNVPQIIKNLSLL